MKYGDFTNLAAAYSDSRPKYSNLILQTILSLGKIDEKSIIIDAGAGTGIWTRMLRNSSESKIFAVEPNADMFESGKKDSENTSIQWIQSSAENMDFPKNTADLITMASSFHWTDYDLTISNFRNTLKKNGIFCALWNSRYYEDNPRLVQVENYLNEHLTKPRVSSGRSGITERLTELLQESFGIENVQYLESKHKEKMSVERYKRIWESVNDVQVQLGPDGFRDFMKCIDEIFKGELQIEATYITRAWLAINN